ncbi:MAG: thiolase family protein [Actinomycetota bacterium]
MDVAIVGIGMHPFGRHDGVSALQQGVVAARGALDDARLSWSDVQFACGGSRDGVPPDNLVAQLGLTGIQFINVYNGCATGGSALFSAATTIQAGMYDLGMAIGYDKHVRGAFVSKDRGEGAWYGESGLQLTTQFFAMKINRYMYEHGISDRTLARVAAKAFRNGSRNEMAWRRKPLTEEQISESPMLSHPLTQYMFCNPGEGAVALLLSRADKAHEYTDRPVYLRSSVVRTRRFGSFEVFAPHIPIDLDGGPTIDASTAAFEQAGLGPDDIDLAQLQDTETGAEVMHMAENGFCEHGEQERMIQLGETEINGRLPINTDGGCLANGEPIGASGLRQVYENVLQLQGRAGDRQVPGTPRTAYTHVYGAPGLSAVTILSR